MVVYSKGYYELKSSAMRMTFGRAKPLTLLRKYNKGVGMDDILRRINVRALVWRDGKVLAVKHKNEDGSATDHWALPGGGLDPMESLVGAVQREVREELGVESIVGELVAVQQFRSKRDDFDEELEVFFNVKDSSAFSSINLNETTHGADEIAEVAFVDPRVEPILPDLLRTMDIDAVLRQKAPVVVENYL